MTTTGQTSVTLNNGVQIPALGFGVFQTAPEDTITAVAAALEDGYRLIDTAAAYGNEREVGEALRRSGIGRSEIHVETKLWISDYGPEKAQVGFDASLRRLGVDYVDVYLLHQPAAANFEDTIAAYQAAEKMLQTGKARADRGVQLQPRPHPAAHRCHLGGPGGQPGRIAPVLHQRDRAGR